MTSTIKVNKHQNACGTNIIQRCGTTTTIGSGASNTLVMDGSAVTIGRCGGTVALASGATQTGFGRTGTVDWQTTVKTGDFTAANGEGYFINTTSGAVTMTLPASPSAGSIVAVADYAGTSGSNVITIARNGSPIEGGTTDASIDVAREAKTFVYIDGTQGWLVVNSNDATAIPPDFITATGGNTVVQCGDYKIHTFTGPGTFTVCTAGGVAANNVVSYLVIAGGASGGSSEGGGGGAGGFREYKSPVDSYTASPLDGNPGGTAVTVNAQAYPITVGAGGASRPCSPSLNGNNGSPSIFSTITSAGGGGGGSNKPGCTPGSAVANSGGSGGGARRDAGNPTAAAGNTPPVSPPQGNNGGTQPTTNWRGAGGGGGAGAVGGNGSGDGGPGGEVAGVGGAGIATSITGSPVTRAGGGGGSINGSPGAPGGGGGAGGSGGGGAGSSPPASATAGTVNTGSGGGGATSKASGAGGSGIVVIRYKFQ